MKQIFKFKKFLGFGGYYAYFISNDKQLFVKVCKGDRELIIQEFSNLKKYWNKLGIKKLNLVEPIKYSDDKQYLITRNIKGKPLNKILKPTVYYVFGKILKKFHNKGFFHGHLEYNDVLYKNGNFFLTDVPFLRINEQKAIDDVITLKLSLNMFKIKRPWFCYKYILCNKAFLIGYKLQDKKYFEKRYKEKANDRIEFLLERNDLFSKIKGNFLKFAFKIKIF